MSVATVSENSTKAKPGTSYKQREGAKFYWRTCSGVTRDLLNQVRPDEEEFRNYFIEIPVRKGDAFYPPGKVHAIGAGIVLL